MHDYDFSWRDFDFVPHDCSRNLRFGPTSRGLHALHTLWSRRRNGFRFLNWFQRDAYFFPSEPRWSERQAPDSRSPPGATSGVSLPQAYSRRETWSTSSAWPSFYPSLFPCFLLS